MCWRYYASIHRPTRPVFHHGNASKGFKRKRSKQEQACFLTHDPMFNPTTCKLGQVSYTISAGRPNPFEGILMMETERSLSYTTLVNEDTIVSVCVCVSSCLYLLNHFSTTGVGVFVVIYGMGGKYQ